MKFELQFEKYLRGYFLNDKGYELSPSALLINFLATENLRVVHCPDCMFYVRKTADFDKSTFIQAARKLMVTDIKIENQVFEFNCKEINFTCDIKRATNNYSQPPCCLKVISNIYNLII